MIPAQSPLVVYPDVDGSPLDGGYLWFGVVNQNPETSPITVYWDEEGTQPVAQPVRTLNGFSVRNGKAARIYVAGEYSLTIKDKRRNLVSYIPSASDASFVLFDELRRDLASTSDGKGAELVAGAKRYAMIDDFGAIDDDSSDCSSAINAAVVYAISRGLIVSARGYGTYRITTPISCSDFVRFELDQATIKATSYSTQSMFSCSNGIEISGGTIDDGGRTIISPTDPQGFLITSSAGPVSLKGVKFNAIRSVLNGTGSLNDRCEFFACSVLRPYQFTPGNADGMNMLVLSGYGLYLIDDNDFYDLWARSCVNITNIQDTISNNAGFRTQITNNRFEYIRRVDNSAEVKAIFVLGTSAIVQDNHFTDVFGRHIDVLSNRGSAESEEVTATTRGNLYPAQVNNNKHAWTIARQSVEGSVFEEAGCIYCRRADVLVDNNYMDFTNLLLTSNTYSAISVRHGFRKTDIRSNTIINPKASGVNVDISDLIDTNNCVAIIENNVIRNHTNGSRWPIAIANNSVSKVYDSVIVTGNSVQTGMTEVVRLQGNATFTGQHPVNFMVVKDNYRINNGSVDVISFDLFPRTLVAQNSSVTVLFDNTASISSAGVINSIDAALTLVSNYYVSQLTVQLNAGIVADQTRSSPISLDLKCKQFRLQGISTADIDFQFAQANQTGLTIACNGADVRMRYIRLESEDNASTTTSLAVLTGIGSVYVSDSHLRYGEFAFDLRGPNLYFVDSTVDDIDNGDSATRAILNINSEINANAALSYTPRVTDVVMENVTGANNSRLARKLSPGRIYYDSAVSVGTTTVLNSTTYTTA